MKLPTTGSSYSRREFLEKSGKGLGAVALAGTLPALGLPNWGGDALSLRIDGEDIRVDAGKEGICTIPATALARRGAFLNVHFSRRAGFGIERALRSVDWEINDRIELAAGGCWRGGVRGRTFRLDRWPATSAWRPSPTMRRSST